MRGADPLGAEVCRPGRRVREKARGADASAGHGLGDEDLIDGGAEVIDKPLAPHAEGFPRLQQGGAAGAVRAVERLEEQVGRDLEGCAHLLADGAQEAVEAAGRSLGVGKGDILAGLHDVDLPRAHLVLVGIPAHFRQAAPHLVERVVAGAGLGLDEGREKALHDGRGQLALGVAPELEQGLDDLREVADASVLIRALALHDV